MVSKSKKTLEELIKCPLIRLLPCVSENLRIFRSAVPLGRGQGSANSNKKEVAQYFFNINERSPGNIHKDYLFLELFTVYFP
jgi:hypothetical protein